jgi:uncharacterized protein YcbX
MPTILALNIYPVKSCRGIALEQARITPAGFEHDRQWLIVDAKNRFLTQREAPRLALIETALDDSVLRLRAPGMTDLTIPIAAPGPSIEVLCWRDLCGAFDMGEPASEWLSEYLGARHRLVRFDERRKRPSSAEWTGEIEALNRFTDAFPWLVISEASLRDLNTRLPSALPMNRFRPNIVIGGVEAYAEDRIHEMTAGGVRLRVVKPCTRCAITTTDQGTGERESDQPLRALKEYRFSRELKGVLFGQNAVLVTGLGESLRAGDELEIAWK